MVQKLRIRKKKDKKSQKALYDFKTTLLISKPCITHNKE